MHMHAHHRDDFGCADYVANSWCSANGTEGTGWDRCEVTLSDTLI